MPFRNLPDRPNLDQYKKQAKELLKAYRSGEAHAVARFRQHHPSGRQLPPRSFQLSDAQFVLAREHGFESWRTFTRGIVEVAGSAAPDATAAIVQLQTPTPREVNLAVFLHGDARLLTATEAEPIRLWDGTAGRLLLEYDSSSNHAWAIRVSDDDRTTFVGCRDGVVRVAETGTGGVRRVLAGHRDLVRCLDVSRDQTRVVSGGMRDHELRLWDVTSEQCLRVFAGHRDGIYSVAIDPAEKVALSGSRDTTVRLWDLRSGECLAVLEGHRYHVHSVAWSADGRRALSCSQEIRLWDLPSKRCLRVFEGHTETIRSVAWSMDQRLALSAAHDRTVRVWEIETGKCIQVFTGHREGVINAVWTGERRIKSCDWAGEVRSWQLA